MALASSAAHSSTRKAARILGLRFRTIPVRAEDGYALTGPALRAALGPAAALSTLSLFISLRRWVLPILALWTICCGSGGPS